MGTCGYFRSSTLRNIYKSCHEFGLLIENLQEVCKDELFLAFNEIEQFAACTYTAIKYVLN